MKKAFITGIAGQDGSYLAELLLAKGYEVHGIGRADTDDSHYYWRVAHIADRISLYSCDVKESGQLDALFRSVMPDEAYHLASRVEPRVIPEEERDIFEGNYLGTLNLLHAINRYKKECRLYCAGSSLMFGSVNVSPQNEETPMIPTNPYGIGKVAGYHFTRMYRETHGIYVCTGILFNHESPRRDEGWLPRKITKAAAEIKVGKQEKLELGDIDAKRDWASAVDVVESMWLMLQQEEPEDYVIGTGELHSVKELLEVAFGYLDLDWKDYVTHSPALVRKNDYVNLCADARKAGEQLHWTPRTGFRELIEQMVRHDLELANKESGRN